MSFRLLSQMIGCLDTMLLLQNQYDFQSRLLQAQLDNTQSNRLVAVVFCTFS